MVGSISINKSEYKEFLGFKKSNFKEKLKLLKKAKNDKLFYKDIYKVQKDFSNIDFEKE